MQQLPSLLGLISLLAVTRCTEHAPAPPQAPQPQPAPALSPEFSAYWFAGTAELSSYEVVQERYGETRNAEQVNVFVTEDFSLGKQVKLDDPAAAGADRVPVLKLNSIRRFKTGIYDYSIMQSCFTPLNGSHTLKSTISVQDWCGHVFMQYNLQPGGYRLQGYSYFESEGDQDQQLSLAMLEDELWTRIRLNPDAIPQGKVQLIPAALHARLRHKENAVRQADIQLQKDAETSVLRVQYSDIPRRLDIRYTTAFPYTILGWEEQWEGKTVSKGTLKTTRKSAYWSEHDNIHAPLRDSLQLRF